MRQLFNNSQVRTRGCAHTNAAFSTKISCNITLDRLKIGGARVPTNFEKGVSRKTLLKFSLLFIRE